MKNFLILFLFSFNSLATTYTGQAKLELEPDTIEMTIYLKALGQETEKAAKKVLEQNKKEFKKSLKEIAASSTKTDNLRKYLRFKTKVYPAHSDKETQNANVVFRQLMEITVKIRPPLAINLILPQIKKAFFKTKSEKKKMKGTKCCIFSMESIKGSLSSNGYGFDLAIDKALDDAHQQFLKYATRCNISLYKKSFVIKSTDTKNDYDSSSDSDTESDSSSNSFSDSESSSSSETTEDNFSDNALQKLKKHPMSVKVLVTYEPYADWSVVQKLSRNDGSILDLFPIRSCDFIANGSSQSLLKNNSESLFRHQN